MGGMARMISREERPVNIGAVYFRRTAPPRGDWERDYALAADEGFNIFRHWFSWAAVEIAPGVYDWAPYDRQMELSARYGIDSIIAEMSVNYPEWLIAKYPEARRIDSKGNIKPNDMNNSTAIGGDLVLCTDHPAIAEGVAGYLRALGGHYKDMPGVYGYDVWNECSFYSPERLCHCSSTQKLFREWLAAKYQTLDALNKAWLRFSFTDWSQIRLPQIPSPYPEFFDAIAFRNDNQEKWLSFCIKELRNADPNHLITAHGNGKAHRDLVTVCGDDWRYSKDVDIFGYTYWYGNDCDAMMAGDMARSASRGKAFWRAEAVGDADWMKRSDADDLTAELEGSLKDKMSDPYNIQIDAMKSFATGASGLLNPRFRPLLDGFLFHAYGWHAPDGSVTERSEMASRIAKWCNAPGQRKLWSARPVKGEIALLLIEDSQAMCYALQGNTDIYSKDLKGAWHAFLDSNIQADIIKIGQIDDYDLVYMPYPVAMSDGMAGKLREWAAAGGALISEACPGYFTGHGHALECRQPARGLGEVFGCVQNRFHFGPDRNKGLVIHSNKGDIRGGVYYQSYNTTTGKEAGAFGNGETAIVENRYGGGRALLIGSMPGYGYFTHRDEGTRRWFSSLLNWAGKKPAVQAPYNEGISIRIWKGDAGGGGGSGGGSGGGGSGAIAYLWVLNFSEHPREADIIISQSIYKGSRISALRGAARYDPGAEMIVASVGQRDATVVALY